MHSCMLDHRLRIYIRLSGSVSSICEMSFYKIAKLPGLTKVKMSKVFQYIFPRLYVSNFYKRYQYTYTSWIWLFLELFRKRKCNVVAKPVRTSMVVPWLWHPSGLIAAKNVKVSRPIREDIGSNPLKLNSFSPKHK